MVVDHAAHYRLTGLLGLNYGPSFQGLLRAEVRGQSLSGSIQLPASVMETASHFLIQPGVARCVFSVACGFFSCGY